MDGWTIIQTFTLPQEAYMAKAFLESSGVNTMLQDELTAQVNNFYSNAIGGIKLWVRNSDVQEGIKILTEGGYLALPDDQEENNWVWVKTPEDKAHCPFCHSDNIGKRKDLNIAAIILYFLLGALFPLFRSTYRCYDCEKMWKYKGNPDSCH